MQPGDGLGIVRFDNLVDTLMPVTDVGPIPGGAGRAQAHNIVNTHDPATTINPRGSTCIGGGIQAGKTALDAAATMYPTNRALIVLTDGLENTPLMIKDVAASLNDRTFPSASDKRRPSARRRSTRIRLRRRSSPSRRPYSWPTTPRARAGGRATAPYGRSGAPRAQVGRRGVATRLWRIGTNAAVFTRARCHMNNFGSRA
jgi:hypothetical protein